MHSHVIDIPACRLQTTALAVLSKSQLHPHDIKGNIHVLIL